LRRHSRSPCRCTAEEPGDKDKRRQAAARIETDYLIVGAGAAGMAFADALIADSDADVVLVDRRHRPGGHWNDA
jgi:cation diffusion facilitator CzcD-associated flavoprotein CzcO